MKLCVVTGEASGDLHTAAVVRELRTLDENLEVFGIGGMNLEREGTRLIHHVRELAIVGLFNVIRHIPMYRRVFDDILDAVDRERPDAVLLVDFPEFNLRLARRLSQRGFRVLYYISPQVWAWRKKRVHEIARYVDHMLVIFPFEEEFFREAGVPVSYVGHPLVDRLGEIPIKGSPPEPGKPVRLALLPGSRRSEVADLLPSMLASVLELSRDLEVDPFVIRAPTIELGQLEAIMDRAGTRVEIVSENGYEALAGAHVAVASSGTATLEAAILGVPVVVMYVLSPLTYLFARRLVKLPHFSLVNIVAGKQVVPELIQSEVNAGRICREIRQLVEPEHHRWVVDELRNVRKALGGRGASRQAAQTIFGMMRKAS